MSNRQHTLQKQTLAHVPMKNTAAKQIDATVGDVLRRLPGMSLTGPAGIAKDIRMRGMDKGYTQVLINGEPVFLSRPASCWHAVACRKVT